jgi:transposase
LAARRIVAGEGLSIPRGGGRREDLRLLLLERRSAVRARTAALNQLSSLLVTAPDQVRDRLGALSGERLAAAAARLRPGSDAVTAVLRRLGRRVARLSEEIAEVERGLAALLAEVAPDLLEECGVGPVCGAQLLVSSGDPDRMTSEASFAALAGTSPVEASSGRQRRHRLNRGGDRQLNWGAPRRRPRQDPPPRRNGRLLPTAARRRQDRPGSTPLRQTRARPLLLPTPTRDADARLDNIEASVPRRGWEDATRWQRGGSELLDARVMHDLC